MLPKPCITATEAAELIKDGMTIMIGGFMAVGTPESLVDAIVASGRKDLTVIANDTGFIDKGVGKLIASRQIKKVIASHIGLNPETGRQMSSGEIEVELVPQGTLIERIRAHGSGLGGVLTQTGLGTIVEEGKAKVDVNGKTYLLETPLKADIALIRSSSSDKAGNSAFFKTTKNFNPVMATAADIVICEAETITDIDEHRGDDFDIPGIFVDYLVNGEAK